MVVQISKLKIVRKALESNGNVTIVSINEENYLPERKEKDYLPERGHWSHIVEFWLAPKNGLHTSGELQAFMEGLVPHLEPTRRDDFIEYPKTLVFGKLYYDEKIGEEERSIKRVLTLTDEELLNTTGFNKGKRTINTEEYEEYLRRIVVKPFPNKKITEDILEGKLCNLEYIDLNDLTRYQQRIL